MLKKSMQNTIALCLCILLFLPILTLFPKAENALPSLEEARAVALYHPKSDTLVLSKAVDDSVGAGSSVKVMAGLLFCELLSSRFSENICVTAEMLDQMPAFTGRSLHIESGDNVTVEQLMYAAVCGSYNDAFYLLASHVSGTVELFLQSMNERAESLGTVETYFEDVTGISGGSRTSASDMIKIALAASQNPIYMQLCNVDSYFFASDRISKNIYNRNALICSQETPKYYNKYCSGMSAGTTTEDGNCVITQLSHDNETYVCVVLGAQETDEVSYGYRITNRLVDWVYDTYSYMEIISPETDVCTIPVTVSDFTDEIKVRTKESLYAYLPRGLEIGKDIIYSIRLTQPSLEAPVKEDVFVGYVAIIYNDRVLETARLYTVETAERSNVISSLNVIQSWTESRAVRAGVLFFVLVMTSWVVTEYILIQRRRKRWNKYFSSKMELSENLIKENGAHRQSSRGEKENKKGPFS